MRFVIVIAKRVICLNIIFGMSIQFCKNNLKDNYS